MLSDKKEEALNPGILSETVKVRQLCAVRSRESEIERRECCNR